MTSGVLVAACVAAATVLAAGPPRRRARAAPRAGTPAWRMLAASVAAALRPAPPTGGLIAQVSADLAVLLRAGAAPAAAWTAAVESLPGADEQADEQADGRADDQLTAPRWGVAAVLVAAGRAAGEGRDVGQVLRAGAAAGAARDAPPLTALAATWTLASRTGAPLADVLERLADGLRAEVAAEDARTSALAAPQATARVLLALPLAGVVLGAVLGLHPLHVLLTTTAARVCAVAGAGLDLLAWLWTRELLRRARRAA